MYGGLGWFPKNPVRSNPGPDEGRTVAEGGWRGAGEGWRARKPISMILHALRFRAAVSVSLSQYFWFEIWISHIFAPYLDYGDPSLSHPR